MANRFLSNIKINDAYTFPASDGTNGQVIKTDGSGNLSFAQLAADSASVMYKDTFTGNGSTTVFNMANALNDEVQSNIYIDGVYQSKSTYSIANKAITFSTAPASGHEIEVISTTGINSGPTAIYTDTFTANGSTTAFTLGQTVHDENQTIVFLNGVYQFKGTYTLSGTTLTLDTAPANGVSIEVMSIGSAYSGGDILYDHDFGSAGLMTTNGSGVYSITANNSANWNTAYGWGDHSTQSYATQSYVGTQISNLVDSSPATLNTLNELAAALGDDPNFATTTANSIGLKAPLASPSFTGNATFAGNITFGAVNPFSQSTNVLDGTGTNGARIRSAVSAAGTPTFSNSDDTDTGMFFPSANSVALSTGGTQALSINSSQNSTFAGELKALGGDVHFEEPNSHTVYINFPRTATHANPTARIIKNEPAATHTSALGFWTSNASGSAPNLVRALYLDESQNATFAGDVQTNKLQLSSDAEHFVSFRTTSLVNSSTTVDTTAISGRRIDLYAYDDIKLRAGTGDSIYLMSGGSDTLTLDNSSNATFAGMITVNGIFTQEYGNAYQIKQGSTEKYYYSNGASYNAFGVGVLGIGTTSDAIQFATSNVVRATINSSGNVGIGVSAPARPLHVNGLGVVARFQGSQTGYTQGAIVLHSGTADSPSARGQGTYRYNEGSDVCWYTGTAYNNTNKYIWARRGSVTSFPTDAGEGTAQTSYALMTLVGSSGNVGIGTASPSAKLNVIDGNNTFVTYDTNTYPRLTVGGGSVQLGLFRSSSNVGGGYIGADGSTCFHVRDASFATKLYLTQGGNLGIGTTTPSKKLDVSGVVRQSGANNFDNIIVKTGNTGSFTFTSTEIKAQMVDNVGFFIMVTVYRPTTDVSNDVGSLMLHGIMPRGAASTFSTISTLKGTGISTLTATNGGSGNDLVVTTDSGTTFRCSIRVMAMGGTS